MRLFEFLENFDVLSEITILYYGSIEYVGKIKDIPFEKLVGSTVKLKEASLLDGMLFISIENEIPKRRNYDVVLKIQEKLSEEEVLFIENIINNLKEEYQIEENDGLFYATEREMSFDDVPRMLRFFNKMQKYKEYFEIMGYVSHIEGSSQMVIRNL